MQARWGEQPSDVPGLATIPRGQHPRDGAPPSSSVYVDDYMNGGITGWVEELVMVAERVFEVAGVNEKKLKREGPDQVSTLLGFVLDTLELVLRIPEGKAAEILVLLD